MTKIQKNLNKLSNQGLLDVEETITMEEDIIHTGYEYQDQIALKAIKVMREKIVSKVEPIRSNAQIEAMNIFGGAFYA